ncbi:MAG: leucine--tRNA ligase [Candidatus Nomurabacteria bacterium]|jgi:leucyl-tRNA synthetase|nr:leucine--tRNA ligase [Candidatus Nomurabacteria bacterium]
MEKYNPKAVEQKWQQYWLDHPYLAEDFGKKPKFVMLTEFPYPSGDGLHLGHTREYTYGDIIARYKRLRGYNVLYPMGFDAFGLPTENFAIKNKIAPQVATARNIANFTKQFQQLGWSFDYSRLINTTDPSYYKWTQWLFLQFFKAGLAYQAEIAINWCPRCKTGLANEEVQNGRHERCDTLVEKKNLKQWMLKITQYADRLIEGLKEVDFPSRIADQQINWIGKSTGAELEFAVDESTKIKVFTTRPDTLAGATFLVLAPEHPLVEQITTKDALPEVNSYRKMVASLSEVDRAEQKEKTGVFTGAYAIHPVSGERLPIWIADYVLMGYGEGAIMAVPTYDERDREFAEKYNLPIVADFALPTIGEAIKQIEQAGFGKPKVNFKLRDWIFSRQHYWGEPIPIIHCPDCGVVPVPEADLPVELPKVDHYEPTDTGESPLAAITGWVNVKCPNCGKDAKRETDTMPNWAGSSWYYLRYFDPRNDKAFAAPDKLAYWSGVGAGKVSEQKTGSEDNKGGSVEEPVFASGAKNTGAVDLYLGGMEHTTLHLLYSRFWHEFFYDQGLVPTPEPYAARRGQGIILAADGRKMSKSLGNVINPSSVIEDGYGADALRLAIAFLAPYDQTTPWNPEGVAGTYRFLVRFWNLCQGVIERAESVARRGITEGGSPSARGDFPVATGEIDPVRGEPPCGGMRKVRAKTIKKVQDNLEAMQYNTAVAALMEGLNSLAKLTPDADTLADFCILLSPFAPHIANELYSQLVADAPRPQNLDDAVFPTYDEKDLLEDEVEVVIQVNGKLRSKIKVPADKIDEVYLNSIAHSDAKVKSFIGSTPVKKTVVLPERRLVNVVI